MSGGTRTQLPVVKWTALTEEGCPVGARSAEQIFDLRSKR